MFHTAGNRLHALARWSWAFDTRTSEFFGGAIDAYRAAFKWVDGLTATPAPAPVINPSHYPDPISYLNRCRHFKRVMILMERQSDEFFAFGDYHGMTEFAVAHLPAYVAAMDAYDKCVADAMSLSLPYPPMPPGPVPDGMPF